MCSLQDHLTQCHIAQQLAALNVVNSDSTYPFSVILKVTQV